MTISFLLDEFKNKPKNGLIHHLKTNENILNELQIKTSFLDEESSISERLYCIIHNIKSKPICACGKQLKFNKLNKGFLKTCGNKDCISSLRGKVNSEKNKNKDWNKILEKTRKTNKERYGVKSLLSKNSPYREKYSKIIEERYGKKHPLQNKEIKRKQVITTLENHGTLDILHTEKTLKTIKERYRVDHPMKNKEIAKKTGFNLSNTKNGNLLNKISEMNLEFISYKDNFYNLKCKLCSTTLNNVTRQIINVSYKQDKSPCHKCYPQNHFRSKGEIEIYNELKKFYKGDIQLNRQYLGKEVDILIPDKKLAIEFNGLYWHSELYKNNNYHIEKKKDIEKKGYDLIQIWEDDWNHKKSIILSRLKNKLGLNEKIGARKCEIKNVSYKESKEFLEKYHLQGNSSSSIRLGLYYRDNLYILCTFGKKRNSIGNNKGYELIRNCSKEGYSIIGGFNRLIKHFTKYYSNELYSYADLDWAPLHNSSYEKIGFTKNSITSPSYFWVIKGVKHNRINFQKHKLVNMGFDKNKSESQIMYEDFKSFKVYNSGNIKFLYNKKEDS